MKKLYFAVLAFSFLLSGCVARTYTMTRDRVDQDLSTGNKGFVQGSPSTETKEKKTTRDIQVFEIEMGSPVKFSRMGQVKETKTAPKTEEGNRGYITQTTIPETPEPAEVQEAAPAGQSFEKYTVQKNDTLQKISMKYFGTSKKWMKIYDANKDILKGPNKLYPGTVISIPVLPGMKLEPKENLK